MGEEIESECIIPRISVFEPSARHLSILLVDCQGIVAEVLLEFVRQNKTRSACANANYINMSLRMYRSEQAPLRVSQRAFSRPDKVVGHGKETLGDGEKREREFPIEKELLESIFAQS